MRRTITIGILLCIIAAGFACTRENEQEKVNKVIKAVQSAAEEKNIRGITVHVAKDYSDSEGNNFEALRALLLAYFFRYPKISGYITHLEITVDGSSARAVFQAILTSSQKTGSVTDAVPEQLGVHRFDVVFKKDSGDWKITSARWSEAGQQNTN